jgi:hypothetical protein
MDNTCSRMSGPDGPEPRNMQSSLNCQSAKQVEPRGLEPRTSAVQGRRSPG